MHFSSGSTSLGKPLAFLTLTILLTLKSLGAPAGQRPTKDENKPKAPVAAESSIKPRGSVAQGKAMMQMPLIAPLFLEDEHYSSKITMIDTVNDAIDVEISVSDANGMEIINKIVHLAAHSQYQVGVKDLLAEAGSAAITGSISIMHNIPSSMPVAAQLSIVSDSDPPGHVEEEFLMSSEGATSVLRSVGFNGSPVVGLKSMSADYQKVKIVCLGQSGEARSQVRDLPPMQLIVARVCDGSNNANEGLSQPLDRPGVENGTVGVDVVTNGHPGELLAFGIASSGNERKRDLTSMYFFDPGSLQSRATVYTGVPVGRSDLLGGDFHPRLGVCNFSIKPAQITVTFSPTLNSVPSPRVVRQFILPGRSTKMIELDELKGDTHLQNSFVINSDGEVGSVLTKMISESEGPLGVVEFQPKDPHQPENAGTHPWSVENEVTSTLLLFNHADAPKYFNVSVHAGSLEWQRAYQLASMETMALSINQLISDQVPDRTGQKLPKDVTNGQLEWINPNPKEGTGRLLQSNVSGHLARSFSCNECGVVCGATLSPGTSLALIISGPDGFLGDLGTVLCASSSCGVCAGSHITTAWSGYNYTWHSNDNSIAPVDGATNQSRANFTPIFGGGTSGIGETQGGSCLAFGSGPISVAPRIDALSPSRGLIGTAFDVIILGSGFGSKPVVKAPTGITVTINPDSQSCSNSAGTICAHFSVASNATSGNNAVTVSVTGSSPSPAKNFFVQIPKNLVRLNFTGCPSGYCPLTLTSSTGGKVTLADGTVQLINQCGLFRNVTYSLLDQDKPQQAIDGTYTLREMFSNYSSSYGGTIPATLNNAIKPRGLLDDTQYLGKTLPNCLGSNDHESFDQSLAIVIGSQVYNMTMVNTISRGYFSGTPKVDITIKTP